LEEEAMPEKRSNAKMSEVESTADETKELSEEVRTPETWVQGRKVWSGSE
jgi:hypothetical protein